MATSKGSILCRIIQNVIFIRREFYCENFHIQLFYKMIMKYLQMPPSPMSLLTQDLCLLRCSQSCCWTTRSHSLWRELEPMSEWPSGLQGNTYQSLIYQILIQNVLGLLDLELILERRMKNYLEMKYVSTVSQLSYLLYCIKGDKIKLYRFFLKLQ